MFKPFWNKPGLLLICLGLVFGAFLTTPLPRAQAQTDHPVGYVLTLDGELTMPMTLYLERGFRSAERDQASLIIIQLNTPGGSIDLMNRLVQEIRANEIPVVVYVTPRGAMAGSAGTVITLAGHAAAMAPETAIGAASPVGSQGEDIGETLEAKVKEMLKATARSLAEKRGPEAMRLAEDTIESAKAVSASEALEAGLVDFVASDTQDLLEQLNGFQVETAGGPVVLDTDGLTLIPLPNSFIEQLLQTLVNPNIVFLLLTIGVQAILIELSSPGGWVAGFIGVVCLALATYGLGILPVNWFGILFLILAFVLFILDIKAPTHGALTATGLGSFIVGALVLFNSPGTPPSMQVSVPLVIGASLITGAVFFSVVTIGIRAQKTPVRTSLETLTGRRGTARSELNPRGSVQVAGELWTARLVPGEPPLPSGSTVEVVAVEGIHLMVRGVAPTGPGNQTGGGNGIPGRHLPDG
jgi:membrane-bound serine protease (ClpP class)